MGKRNFMYGKALHITRSRQRHEKHISIRIDSDGKDAGELTEKIRKMIHDEQNLNT